MKSMDGQAPRVSVVISTYNRAAHLPAALDALCAQRGVAHYEVIVVDNNSSDGTAELVQTRLSGHPHLRYIFEPRQGLPYARNTGVLAARAPIVAFTDDDVEVGPEWVSTIERTFAENPDVDVIGGRVHPIWPASVPRWITPRQLGPFALGERGNARMRVSADNAAPCLVGANFAFRREVFDRIGLFDPAFVKSQDREIQLRLWRAGGVGLYVPEMAITVAVPAERLTKKYFRYWYSMYGVYHSRMRLLDAIDRDGRLVQPRGRHWLGAPVFLYRSLLRSVWQWCISLIRMDSTAAFHWENRIRYLFNYLKERSLNSRGSHGAQTAATGAALKIP